MTQQRNSRRRRRSSSRTTRAANRDPRMSQPTYPFQFETVTPPMNGSGLNPLHIEIPGYQEEHPPLHIPYLQYNLNVTSNSPLALVSMNHYASYVSLYERSPPVYYPEIDTTKYYYSGRMTLYLMNPNDGQMYPQSPIPNYPMQQNVSQFVNQNISLHMYDNMPPNIYLNVYQNTTPSSSQNHRPDSANYPPQYRSTQVPYQASPWNYNNVPASTGTVPCPNMQPFFNSNPGPSHTQYSSTNQTWRPYSQIPVSRTPPFVDRNGRPNLYPFSHFGPPPSASTGIFGAQHQLRNTSQADYYPIPLPPQKDLS